MTDTAQPPVNTDTRRFEIIKEAKTIPAFVISFEGKRYAYENRCPHRGTQLDWQPGEFFDETQRYLICATHGALFEPDTGKCVSGPCMGESLAAVRIPSA